MSAQSQEVIAYVEEMRCISEKTSSQSQIVVNATKEQLNDVENNLNLINILNDVAKKLESLSNKIHL